MRDSCEEWRGSRGPHSAIVRVRSGARQRAHKTASPSLSAASAGKFRTGGDGEGGRGRGRASRRRVRSACAHLHAAGARKMLCGEGGAHGECVTSLNHCDGAMLRRTKLESSRRFRTGVTPAARAAGGYGTVRVWRYSGYPSGHSLAGWINTSVRARTLKRAEVPRGVSARRMREQRACRDITVSVGT